MPQKPIRPSRRAREKGGRDLKTERSYGLEIDRDKYTAWRSSLRRVGGTLTGSLVRDQVGLCSGRWTARAAPATDLNSFSSLSCRNRTPPINPFPGLRPFREDEEHLFFGRENQVDAMVNKLADTRFLAVVGTSGSGKSSLVNCGLRPALRQGLMARAGTAWRIAQFRPGNDPIGAMARALAQDGVLFSAYTGEGISSSSF
jgi:hypothetical protein